MRIIIKKSESGLARVIIKEALDHDGEAHVEFLTALVPSVEIDEGVQAEIFVPMATARYNAVDYDKISPRPLLSIWNGKAEGAADSTV